jgi:23S rRNA (uracil1939-C5)-methyltransferase
MMRILATPFELEIDDLTLEGQGVGRREGKACFVPDALPGERVRVLPTGGKHNFDTGLLDAVLRASPDRVTPTCRWFGTCGGCRLMHLSIVGQRRVKQKALLEALKRLGNVTPEIPLPPIVDQDLGYRRTTRLGVKYVSKKGGTLVGFRERGGRFLADMEDCQVLHPALGERIAGLRQLIDRLEQRQRIPQIEAVVDDDDSVALVFRHLQPLPAHDLEHLRGYAQAEGVQVLLQPSGPDSVAWLAGPDRPLVYRHPDFGVEIEFTALDFIQAHAGVNRQMVAQVVEWMGLDAGTEVLDLYCGLGNFTLPLARRASSVLAVEADVRMLERARRNAERQGILNTTYVRADLEALVRGAEPWGQRRFDRALLDPPRTGAAAVVETLGARRIPRLVYVSCNPATLARDASTLVHQHGYRLLAAGILDMFPHTAHVESMAVFIRE